MEAAFAHQLLLSPTEGNNKSDPLTKYRRAPCSPNFARLDNYSTIPGHVGSLVRDITYSPNVEKTLAE